MKEETRVSHVEAPMMQGHPDLCSSHPLLSAFECFRYQNDNNGRRKSNGFEIPRVLRLKLSKIKHAGTKGLLSDLMGKVGGRPVVPAIDGM